MSDEPPRMVDENPRTYEVKTHGCQMNVHDSERLSGLLSLVARGDSGLVGHILHQTYQYNAK